MKLAALILGLIGSAALVGLGAIWAGRYRDLEKSELHGMLQEARANGQGNPEMEQAFAEARKLGVAGYACAALGLLAFVAAPLVFSFPRVSGSLMAVAVAGAAAVNPRSLLFTLLLVAASVLAFRARPGEAGRVAPLGLVAVLLLAAACGRPGSDDVCIGGLIGPALPCPCHSWTNYVISTEFRPKDCVYLFSSADLSTNPAVARIRVGDRFLVRLATDDRSPDGCNEGWDTSPSWASTNVSVLMFERGEGNLESVVFRAVGPGAATVVAEDLLAPNGQTERLALTACRGPGYPCEYPVPLQIHVLP
jgi:hypothetical protein